jgi:lysozyme
LKNDCKWVDACLDKNVKVNLNQNQFDALASFVYNIGETAFIKSTMLTLIHQNSLTLVASQFDRWVFDNGKRMQGLVNRRLKEKELFLK